MPAPPPCPGALPSGVFGSPPGYSPAGFGHCCPDFVAGCDRQARDDCLQIFGWQFNSTTCTCHREGVCTDSPVLLDIGGDGFALTDARAGVPFDLDRDGRRERPAWTPAGSDDAWLALDRDGNRRVDDGGELFGNRTEQPASARPNGFAALAEFDRAARGGNSDGRIDRGDAVCASLRLWRDANHDGVSQPWELHTLAALGGAALHLDYKLSKRVGEHGNQLRYRAKVDDARRARVNRWAWDVFLVSVRQAAGSRRQKNARGRFPSCRRRATSGDRDVGRQVHVLKGVHVRDAFGGRALMRDRCAAGRERYGRRRRRQPGRRARVLTAAHALIILSLLKPSNRRLTEVSLSPAFSSVLFQTHNHSKGGPRWRPKTCAGKT